MDSTKSVKVVVVGDGNVGKTCLIKSFVEKTYDDAYIPTVFEFTNYQFKVDDRNVAFDLVDTAGQETYARLRPLTYADADIFILCFAVNNWHSFDNIASVWLPEIKHHRKGVPYILCGTKTDCEYDETIPPLVVTDDVVFKSMKKLRASAYVRCSAVSRIGIDEVFATAYRVADKHSINAVKRKCVIL